MIPGKIGQSGAEILSTGVAKIPKLRLVGKKAIFERRVQGKLDRRFRGARS